MNIARLSRKCLDKWKESIIFAAKKEEIRNNIQKMKQARRLPLGIQDFEEMRRDGYLYVDKTDMVWQLANGDKYNYLSRPRRFGKSLLCSTLKCYFEGK